MGVFKDRFNEVDIGDVINKNLNDCFPGFTIIEGPTQYLLSETKAIYKFRIIDEKNNERLLMLKVRITGSLEDLTDVFSYTEKIRDNWNLKASKEIQDVIQFAELYCLFQCNGLDFLIGEFVEGFQLPTRVIDDPLGGYQIERLIVDTQNQSDPGYAILKLFTDYELNTMAHVDTIPDDLKEFEDTQIIFGKPYGKVIISMHRILRRIEEILGSRVPEIAGRNMIAYLKGDGTYGIKIIDQKEFCL